MLLVNLLFSKAVFLLRHKSNHRKLNYGTLLAQAVISLAVRRSQKKRKKKKRFGETYIVFPFKFNYVKSFHVLLL